MAVTGLVYYCPDLRLYRYKVSNSDNPDMDMDTKFDADELEDIMVAQLAAAAKLPKVEKDEREAQVRTIANVTALARTNPHKIVTFDFTADRAKFIDPVEHWKKHDAERDARDAREKEQGR